MAVKGMSIAEMEHMLDLGEEEVRKMLADLKQKTQNEKVDYVQKNSQKSISSANTLKQSIQISNSSNRRMM
jgi:predicted phage gp36 major capsid-like protein